MMFTVFTHSPKGLLGSPSQVCGLLRPMQPCLQELGILTPHDMAQVYDNLQVVSRLAPVSGNRGGSYLTFWSIDGALLCAGDLCMQLGIPSPGFRCRAQVWHPAGRFLLG